MSSKIKVDIESSEKIQHSNDSNERCTDLYWIHFLMFDLYSSFSKSKLSVCFLIRSDTLLLSFKVI